MIRATLRRNIEQQLSTLPEDNAHKINAVNALTLLGSISSHSLSNGNKVPEAKKTLADNLENLRSALTALMAESMAADIRQQPVVSQDPQARPVIGGLRHRRTEIAIRSPARAENKPNPWQPLLEALGEETKCLNRVYNLGLDTSCRTKG